jgi:hypothetical protein
MVYTGVFLTTLHHSYLQTFFPSSNQSPGEQVAMDSAGAERDEIAQGGQAMELTKRFSQFNVFVRFILTSIFEFVPSHHVVGRQRFQYKLIRNRHGQGHGESPDGQVATADVLDKLERHELLGGINRES